MPHDLLPRDHTEDNFSDLIAMKRPENERFLASNAASPDEDAEERILFPPEHEGKGCGAEPVRLLIRLAARSGKCDCVQPDCAADNAVARLDSDKLRFVPTGDVNHGDIELRRARTDGDKA